MMSLVILPLTLYAATPDPSATAVMLEETETYFHQEKAATNTAMFLGAGSLLTGAMFVSTGDDRYQGAALSVAVLGLLEIVVGATVYFRTDAQLARLQKQIKNDPRTYVAEEGARIDTVNFWFNIYRIAELAILAGGATLVVATDKPFLEGLGYGLAVQAAIAIVFDLMAEARAHRYADAIKRFSVGIAQTEDRAGDKTTHAQLLIRF